MRLLLDGPGSRTQTEIGQMLGCSQAVVSRATRALKIIGYAPGIFADLPWEGQPTASEAMQMAVLMTLESKEAA
jgi:hypothetical protein